jgi:exodeoxyribonuclease VII small subunit
MPQNNDGETPSKSAGKPDKLTFEQAMNGIELAVGNLEGGELELDRALKVYEDAVKMVRRCHLLLGDAERQVELLVEVREDGTVETQPFDEEEESLTEKQESRSRRRSTTRKDDDVGSRLF